MKKTEEQFHKYAKSTCRKQLRLLPVLVKETVRLGRGHSVLMVETSGRGRLTGRQACAVESAARRFAKVVISIVKLRRGQARIGKGWPLRRKASKLKPEPRAYIKVG